MTVDFKFGVGDRVEYTESPGIIGTVRWLIFDGFKAYQVKTEYGDMVVREGRIRNVEDL